jgi:hypothetical protein
VGKGGETRESHHRVALTSLYLRCEFGVWLVLARVAMPYQEAARRTLRTSTALTSALSGTSTGSTLITTRLNRHGLKEQHYVVVRGSQYTALSSPTCCSGMQSCPLPLLSSHCADRFVPCIHCMQTMLVRCPRSTTPLAGWGVSAANAADGAMQLSRRREVMVYSQDAGAMRCSGRYEQVPPT